MTSVSLSELAAPAPLLTFPHRCPMKVLGGNHPEFVDTVHGIIQQHHADFDATHSTVRASSGDKWLSVTCIVTFHTLESMQQLQSALQAHPLVKIVM